MSYSRKRKLLIIVLCVVPLAATVGSRVLAAPRELAPFFLPIDSRSDKSEDASVAIDTSGAVQVAYVGYTTAFTATSVYYAYCPVGCNDSASWSAGRVAGLGGLGGRAVLKLSPDGHPRLMWVTYDDQLANTIYEYATCDITCTVPAHWTVTSIVSAHAGLPANVNYFVLDNQGRPRFVYLDDSGTFYDFCNANCTNSASWTDVKVTSGLLYYPWLALSPSGQPRLAYWSKYSNAIGYVECNAACDVPANWAGTMLYPQAPGLDPSQFAFQVNHSGEPRLMLFGGNPGTLSYAWCHAACTSTQSWDRQDLGLPAAYGAGPSLAIDSQGRPRVSYLINFTENRRFDALGYALCLADCETHSPTWRATIIEASINLPAVPSQAGCSQGTWFIGGATSLALDGMNNPRFGYAAYHYQGGKGDPCLFTEDIHRARFTEWNGNGLLHFMFVPLVEH